MLAVETLGVRPRIYVQEGQWPIRPYWLFIYALGP